MPLARSWREIVKDSTTWAASEEPTGKEYIKYGETRFASKVLMLQRYLPLRPAAEILMSNQNYVNWTLHQKADVRDKAAETKAIITDGEHWEKVKMALTVLQPALKIMRETDAKKGKSLGYVYDGLLKLLLKLYSEPIDDLREKIHGIFYERGDYFDKPIIAAAYLLDPEYWNYDHEPSLDAKLQAVFDQMTKTPECKFTGSATWDEYGTVRTLVELEKVHKRRRLLKINHEQTQV